MAWLRLGRNLLIFVYAMIVELSVFQFAFLFGFYAPIGVVLTASAMPYAPPMSVAIVLPEPPGPGYAGWAIALVDACLPGGVPVKVPVMHRFVVGPGYCYEDIPNGKAVLPLTGNPLDALLAQLEALIPPWPEVIRPCPYRPAFKVAFVIPAWIFAMLMAFALRYRLYYGFRRVW
jgi:hypothetical protein